jgi:hypothetical protein
MSLAQQQPIYKPALRLIANITQSFPALVTTTFAHGYFNGLQVRIFLPPVYGSTVVAGIRYQGFGMEQINNLKGTVTITDDPTVFSLDIDTSNFDPFVMPPNQDPPDTQVQYAQVIPAGGNGTQNAYIDVLPY